MKISLNEQDLRNLVFSTVKSILHESKNTDMEKIRKELEMKIQPVREAGFHPEVKIISKWDSRNIAVYFPEKEIDVLEKDRDYYNFVDSTLMKAGFKFDPNIGQWLYAQSNDAIINASKKRGERQDDFWSDPTFMTDRQYKISRKSREIDKRLHPEKYSARKGRSPRKRKVTEGFEMGYPTKFNWTNDFNLILGPEEIPELDGQVIADVNTGIIDSENYSPRIQKLVDQFIYDNETDILADADTMHNLNDRNVNDTFDKTPSYGPEDLGLSDDDADMENQSKLKKLSGEFDQATAGMRNEGKRPGKGIRQ